MENISQCEGKELRVETDGRKDVIRVTFPTKPIERLSHKDAKADTCIDQGVGIQLSSDINKNLVFL